ncbi:hypothetical protein [Streptomyces sp. NBC_00140]|uniref:hypothetical protein n=1 Tax=Streptomyces sp. NBC_00140 TaxID=2975664 RepID=UPI0022513769|nr:hypothetical protein [Streptomyces sp. NBC_00140]MCX5336864.1 hypothetical protein [Streptomyces sp. NBC_00140]
MAYRADLAVQVDEALMGLSDDDRQEVMELIAEALVDPNSWPAPDGWTWALRAGPRMWMVFTADLDGIDVLAIGEIDVALHAA